MHGLLRFERYRTKFSTTSADQMCAATYGGGLLEFVYSCVPSAAARAVAAARGTRRDRRMLSSAPAGKNRGP